MQSPLKQLHWHLNCAKQYVTGKGSNLCFKRIWCHCGTRLANRFSLHECEYNRDHAKGLPPLTASQGTKKVCIKLLVTTVFNYHIFAGWPMVTKAIATASQSWGHILWHFSLFLQCPQAYQQKSQAAPPCRCPFESKREQWSSVPLHPTWQRTQASLGVKTAQLRRPTENMQVMWERIDRDPVQLAVGLETGKR